MNEKTFAAVALSNRDFPSFDAKLQEAAKWVEFAAAQGADVVVLPEGINLYKGDGPGNPNAMTIADAALDDWRRQTAVLTDAATRCKVAITIPVYTREKNGSILNSFFFLDHRGQLLGQYTKIRPTIGEMDEGTRPGDAIQPLIEWEGLKIGSAICFDTNFLPIFESQAKQGADVFLVPSLWPGGSQLNYYALQYSTPIVLSYPAWSRIIDIDGKEIAEGGYRSESLRFGFGAPVIFASINFDRVVLHADYNQAKMIDVQSKYGKRVRVTFDQQNMLLFLESRCRELTTESIVKEFELLPRREYLAQCEKRCVR
jgi:predicted amidohydrolase